MIFSILILMSRINSFTIKGILLSGNHRFIAAFPPVCPRFARERHRR